ncbi:MAG: ABC transporter ATP-binding protein [Phycisphaerae bacterium]
MTDIRLDNISKLYPSAAGAVRAVDGVSLDIVSGEFFFLLGPSGCGKTTLLRIIAGLVEPSGGRVYFDDDDVTGLSVERRRTAMVFQNYALWPHMTVGQNVEFGPKMQGLGRDERRRVATENLALVQMADFARRKPSQLSGGQQQRVALARALAARGRCLLLDEPLSNLDARLRLHMRHELRQLVKAAGMTAVYVTHDQKEALSMADRIAVMNAGRIIQSGPPQELYDRPATRFVADFLGEANFIDGRISETAGGRAVVETPVGRLAAASEKPLAVGAPVTVCIRPERLSISASADGAGAGAECRLPATIVSATYLGEIRQFTCRLANGAIWRVSQLAGAGIPPAEGQAVTLLASAADAVLLTQ